MPLQIQFTTLELKQAEEFCRKCLLYRAEIEKLFECGFFEFKIGLISVHFANKVIRKIDKPEEWKWTK